MLKVLDDILQNLVAFATRCSVFVQSWSRFQHFKFL